MKQLVADLRSRGLEVNAPATPAQLAELESALGAPLPGPVRELYETFNGLLNRDQGDLWCSPLNTASAAYALADLREPYQEFDLPDLLHFGIPLFNDGGDNYLVYCTLPECPGRIVYSHHEVLFEPQVMFTDLREVFEVRTDSDSAYVALNPTYPRRAGEFSGDEAAADACIAKWRGAKGEAALFYLSLACGLLPSSRLNELLSWLDEAEPKHLRPIYDSLGQRGDARAIPALERLMHRVKRDGGSFSSELGWIAEAIASIGTDAAANALNRLNREIPDATLVNLLDQLSSDAEP